MPTYLPQVLFIFSPFGWWANCKSTNSSCIIKTNSCSWVHFCRAKIQPNYNWNNVYYIVWTTRSWVKAKNQYSDIFQIVFLSVYISSSSSKVSFTLDTQNGNGLQNDGIYFTFAKKKYICTKEAQLNSFAEIQQS